MERNNIYKVPSSIQDLTDNQRIADLEAKHLVYEATKDNFYTVLQNAPEGAIIDLKTTAEDNFVLDLTRYYSATQDVNGDGAIGRGEIDLIDLYPYNNNITIKNGTVNGVKLTSGISQAYYYPDMDTSGKGVEREEDDFKKSILPSGLKFENMSFTDHFKVYNCLIENLTIENCIFKNEANILIKPNAIKGVMEGSDSYRYQGKHKCGLSAAAMAKNITIQNNIFEAYSLEGKNPSSGPSRILAFSVNNLLIENNIINTAHWNAFQIGATNNGLPHSTGNIIVKNNFFKNIGSRISRMLYFKDANIQIVNNAFYQKDQLENNNDQIIKLTNYDNCDIEISNNIYNNIISGNRKSGNDFYNVVQAADELIIESNSRYCKHGNGLFEYWRFSIPNPDSNIITINLPVDILSQDGGVLPTVLVTANPAAQSLGLSPLLVKSIDYDLSAEKINKITIELVPSDESKPYYDSAVSVYVNGVWKI